jgi:hypothetical protein
MHTELLANLGRLEWSILAVFVLLCVVLFLVLRQNRKDYLDLVDSLIGERPRYRDKSAPARRR